MLTRERRETLSFDEAIRTEEVRCRGARPGDNAPSYVGRGFYSRQLARVWDHFPREQTLILRSDALKTQPTLRSPVLRAFLAYPRFPSHGPSRFSNCRMHSR